MDHLENFTEEDLLMSESFHNWAKEHNPEDMRYWEEWLSRYPEKYIIAQNAKNIILNLSSDVKLVPNHEIRQAWTQLQQTIQKRSLSKNISHTTSRLWEEKTIKLWYMAAAIFLGLCVSGFFGWQLFTAHKHIQYYTEFGETKTLLLPDKTQVTLNGNTRLSYREKWYGQEDREVWLNGEAYFSVTKSIEKDKAKFVVHTENLDVEVLGTQFNISNWKNSTQIVLNEGEVKVNQKKELKAAPMIMKPGELLKFCNTQHTIIKKIVNPQMYSSWKFKKMVFEETSVREIAERIELTYGYQVKFNDQALAGRKLTGTIPSDNIDVLLLTLSKLFSLNIQKEKNQILIK